MNIKKILISLSMIGAVAAVVIGGTGAFFSDTETSTGNTFTAGDIDLKIDNTSYYNGAFSSSTSWTLRDLTIQKFFDFTDVKPGDFGEDTISLHVGSNDAWVCADVKLTSNDDVTCTSPELVDDPSCTVPGLGTGELASQVNFIWWKDDGDNVLEADEVVLPGGNMGSLAVGQTATVALADSSTNLFGPVGQAVPGNSTNYIAKAWCFGTVTPAPLAQDGLGASSPRTPANSTGGIACDGASIINNAAQTDKFTADISFRAVQARHNDKFLCTPPAGGPTTATLHIRKLVGIGGNATSTNFNIHVTASGASTSTFKGSSTGVNVTVNPGAYSVKEDVATSTYTQLLGAGCTGSIIAGATAECIIKNTPTSTP